MKATTSLCFPLSSYWLFILRPQKEQLTRIPSKQLVPVKNFQLNDCHLGFICFKIGPDQLQQFDWLDSSAVSCFFTISMELLPKTQKIVFLCPFLSLHACMSFLVAHAAPIGCSARTDWQFAKCWRMNETCKLTSCWIIAGVDIIYVTHRAWMNCCCQKVTSLLWFPFLLVC